MKNQIILLCITLLMVACSDSKKDSLKPATNTKKTEVVSDKGIGEFKNVQLSTTLDETMIATGKGIYDLKCAACHKLSDKRLVGPGFKGVTKKRTPEWILNMITNVDVMLDKDPEAQKLLQECLTRMPNQNVAKEEALAILEYLRKNDGET